MRREGLSAYSTSAGWLGYGDEQVRRLCHEAVAAGWKALKFKVGKDTDHDLVRCRIAREDCGIVAPADDRRQPGLGGR